VNSFIFSFKIYVMVFISISFLFLIIFIIGSEILLKHKVSENNHYENVRNNLWNGKKKYVVFGDSRALDGINENAFLTNFSLQGNNLETILAMADFHLKMNNIKTIVLQADPHFFAMYRLSKNQDHLIDDLIKKRRFSFMLLRPQYRQYILEYWSNYFQNFFKKNIKYNNKMKINKNNMLNDQKTVQIRVDTQIPIKNFSKTIQFLKFKNFIDTIKKSGVNLCMVSLPVSLLYKNKALKYKSYKSFFSFLKKLADENNIIYKNYFNRFTNIYFKDADHLNRNGSKLLTKLVLSDCLGIKN
tara:strand:- start:455 stop:1354 length:900 start_codon:yes stop_codon:yes gene_type:complete